MRVLICGDYGVFCKELIGRLKKEKHEVYVITGSEHAKRKKPAYGVFQDYHFSYRSKNIQTIMSNVRADVMIMLGFCDVKYEWKDLDKDSVIYLTGMTNLLTAAKENKIKKVIYCSTLGIFENSNKKKITLHTETSTKTKLMRMMEQVDNICAEQNSQDEFEVIRLRFPEVYGDVNTHEYNICANLMSKYINQNVIEICPNKEHRIIYVKDAVNAIMFLLEQQNCRNLYMVPGTIHCESEILDEIVKIFDGQSVEVIEKTDKVTAAVSQISCDLITDEKYNLHTGLEEFSKVIENNSKIVDEKKFKFSLGPKSFAILENVGLFFIITFISYLFKDSWFIENAQLYLFYILIIAAQYGCNHALLSGGLVIFISLINIFLESKTLDYSGLINEIQYLIAGVLTGYMRDHYRQKNAEIVDEKRYFETELIDMTRIYDGNRYVKEMYEKRIVNYENSLSTIYDITKKLDYWEPQKVIFQAIKVVEELMGVQDVAIYIAGKNKHFMRLSAATEGRARNLGNSIQINDQFFMYEEIVQKNSYINKNLDVRIPSMACGVYEEDQLNAIVMIWTDDLLQLNLYQSNMLALLCKLIENAMSRAYVYWNEFSQQYMKDSNVLLESSFRSILEILKYGKENNLEEYVLLKVNTELSHLNQKDLYKKIPSLIREMDYVGKLSDDLFVLLTNADETDVKNVIDRCANEGFLLELAYL